MNTLTDPKFASLTTAYLPGINTTQPQSTLMSCSITNPITTVGFKSLSHWVPYYLFIQWKTPHINDLIVDGFYTGCTPLEALLESTLDCLYSYQCIQLLKENFPNITQMNISVLISNKEKRSVFDYFNNLFIDEWLININYSKYFHKCSPSICTYKIWNQTDSSSAITLLISLYGGLILILRLITPYLIKISFHLKDRFQNQNVSLRKKLIQSIKRLNLFKKIDHRTEMDIKQQKISTCVYFLLFINLCLIFILFNSLNKKIILIRKDEPSLMDYKNLRIKYSSTLECPCSNLIILYKTFFLLSPQLHQICTSDFLNDQWLSIIKEIQTRNQYPDWRNTALSQFELLSDLCRLSNETIDDAINRFLLKPFVVLNLLSEENFYEQINATFNQFSQSTINYFQLFMKTAGILRQIDQPYFGVIRNPGIKEEKYNPIGIFTNNKKNLKVVFQLTGPRHVELEDSSCICAINSNCQVPLGIYDVDKETSATPIYIKRYIAQGLVSGCSTLDSLMLSTFECYYNNSNCLSILMKYSKDTYIQNVEYPKWFNIRSLIYDSKTSRFLPNTTISKIINEIMIEQWNPLPSYEQFYYSCSPKYCTYSEKTFTKTIIEVIIIFVSTISGLNLTLRISVPKLIQFIFYLIQKFKNRQQQQQQQQDHPKLCIRLKVSLKKLTASIHNHLIQCNIFYLRDFSSKIDRRIRKQLGQWSTRLYFILFLISLTILMFYNFIQHQKFIKTFDQLSPNLTKKLFQTYKDDLKCPCSSIASTYNWSTQIDVKFHQICSSSFVNEEGRNNLTNNIIKNLSSYSQNDYRRYFSSHLQFLEQLCQLSKETLEISLRQFLSSLFLTPELLSEDQFSQRLETILEQMKINTPKTFNRLLFLIRSINHGNAFVSNYGTNYEYINPWNSILHVHTQTKPLIYDNQCSCGLSSNCTTQANFFRENSTEIIPIQGLKIGCLPSESFRFSTLECFYNKTCLELIQYYMKSNSFNYLLSSERKSRFLLNTTIDELTNELFIEEWITSQNYFSYFNQCSPLICSYTYIQKYNIIQSIIILFGLQGGLTIVLKSICPKLIQIIYKLYIYQINKRNAIQPIQNMFITTNENLSSNINHSIRCSFKFIFLCFLLIIIIISLIIYSIQINKKQSITTISFLVSTTINTILNSSTDILATTATNMRTTTTTTTRKNTSKPICSLKFESILTDRSSSQFLLDSHIIADFNDDNLLDIAFTGTNKHSLNVLLGNGNGSFKEEIISAQFAAMDIKKKTVGDFDKDNKVDIAILHHEFGYILILFGNNDGTFTVKSYKIWITYGSDSTDITVGDFNEDKYDDICVTIRSGNSVAVFFGIGDGEFSSQITLYTGLNSYPKKISIQDFNNDHHQDIVVINSFRREIGVFLGYGNGSFQDILTSFTGGFYYPESFGFGDFNSDGFLDIAVARGNGRHITVMFGYGNGTVGDTKKFQIGKPSAEHQIYVSDFNGDQYLDIGFGLTDRTINILIGNGNGEFELEEAFSTRFEDDTLTWIGIGDFNNDAFNDIIHVDVTSNSYDVFLNQCQ
ncbi:unnamed protein product [Adineta ricciae]|nr:unnamed protein product [Adineta ricciae]